MGPQNYQRRDGRPHVAWNLSARVQGGRAGGRRV